MPTKDDIKTMLASMPDTEAIPLILDLLHDIALSDADVVELYKNAGIPRSVTAIQAWARTGAQPAWKIDPNNKRSRWLFSRAIIEQEIAADAAYLQRKRRLKTKGSQGRPTLAQLKERVTESP